MRMTFALAALLTATAFTPALAQNMGHGGRGNGGGQAQHAPGQGGGGWQGQGRVERPQGGWQRGPQTAPAPVAQPQPQQMERRWNGGGLGAQPGWDRGQNRQHGDAGRGQMGGTPGTPPPVVNRDERRWDGNRPERGGWSGTFGNNGRAWQQGRNDGWRGRPGDGDNRWGNNTHRPDNRGWNGNNGWNNDRGWNRDWRRDRQYDWQRYRYSNRDLFRGRPYYAPYGWGYGYQRFSIGFTLNNLLFGQQYWIDSPYDYRLPPVDGPYRWVRYYNDVLLVDLRNGQVVDAIYDFFW